MGPYERLLAWQACHRLALDIYRTTTAWPAEERYGLTAQARRAAFSAAANIAEGSARRGSREWRRFLDIALGSIAELTYIIRLARELGFLSDETATRLEDARNKAGRLTWGLYARVSKAR